MGPIQQSAHKRSGHIVCRTPIFSSPTGGDSPSGLAGFSLDGLVACSHRALTLPSNLQEGSVPSCVRTAPERLFLSTCFVIVYYTIITVQFFIWLCHLLYHGCSSFLSAQCIGRLRRSIDDNLLSSNCDIPATNLRSGSLQIRNSHLQIRDEIVEINRTSKLLLEKYIDVMHNGEDVRLFVRIHKVLTL